MKVVHRFVQKSYSRGEKKTHSVAGVKSVVAVLEASGDLGRYKKDDQIFREGCRSFHPWKDCNLPRTYRLVSQNVRFDQHSWGWGVGNSLLQALCSHPTFQTPGMALQS